MVRYLQLEITKGKIITVLLTVTIVVFALFGIARAAIPNSSTGKIEACRRNSSSIFDAQGTLRAIDVQAGQTCNSNETPLSWDAQSANSTGILSNRLVVTYGSTNQSMLTIPEFGEITAGCSGSSAEGGLFYRNTTSSNVAVYGKKNVILPNEIVQFDTTSVGNGTKNFLISYNDGIKNHVAQLSLGGENVNTSPYPCIYAVMVAIGQ